MVRISQRIGGLQLVNKLDLFSLYVTSLLDNRHSKTTPSHCIQGSGGPPSEIVENCDFLGCTLVHSFIKSKAK